MATNSDLLLSVSSPSLGSPSLGSPNLGSTNAKHHSMGILSPLMEDDDERDRENANISRLENSYPKIEISEENDKTLFTEYETAEYISTKQSGLFAIFVPDNNVDESRTSSHVISERLTSDGEMFDEIYSDDNESSSHSENEVDYETDLEFDEEKWLYPERFELDLTGKSKYIKVCEDMGISPTTYFIKHIQDRELKMKFHGLGPQRMKALAVPLQTNTNIEILNLEGNAIDEDGAICLTKVLKENFFITELVLASNNLRTEGGKTISEMLINNRNLYKVDLSGNEIGDGAAPTLCDVLMNNKLLKILLLANNSFEDEGARLFKASVSENTSLEVLDLSWNNFKSKGAILLAEAMQENVGLKCFNMAMAGLGKEGAEVMAHALKENRTLLELDISLNRINLEGAIALAKGLKENDTLRVLKIGSNPFDSEGAMVILEGLEENEACELRFLDFSNIMVKTKFAKLQEKLEEERKMKIISKGVIPEYTRTNSAKLTAFRVDPAGTFKSSVDHANIDLGKLFGRFLDEEYTVDIKEFKRLIKGTTLDMSDEQVNTVALRLAVNGRVQCRSLFDIQD